MARRTVRIGVMSYVGEGGLPRFALSGEVVEVQESDLARFDRYNGPQGDAEAESEADNPTPERPRGNASRDTWAAYADALGIEYDEMDGRDEIRAAIDATHS